MRTIKLIIEYDGTNYAGWQIQPSKPTIQKIIQSLLEKITCEKIKLVGASRTDAGVHAMGQVAHFRTHSKITPERLEIALSGLLPDDISVKSVSEVSSSFHAQKDAKRKKYLYLIWNYRLRSALLKDRVGHVWKKLDLKSMRKGARYLVGRHDFSAFRGAQFSTKTSVREIEQIKISRVSQSSLIAISIMGNGFLKYMVRNIVGTLIAVGKGKKSPEDVRAILRSKDRKRAGATAPASGLYLESISYVS